MERKDLEINCREIVEMVNSGKYKLNLIYWTMTKDNYFQLKDDINLKIALNNSEVKGPFLSSDINPNYDVDDYLFKNMKIDKSKPLYTGYIYTFEESYIGEGGFMSLDDFLDFIEENPNNYSLSQYVEDWNDYGWVNKVVGDVTEESKIKIGTSEPNLVEVNGLFFYEFEDNISTIICEDADYDVRDWGIDFLVNQNKDNK